MPEKEPNAKESKKETKPTFPSSRAVLKAKIATLIKSGSFKQGK